MAWEDKIVGHEKVDPATLIAHPDNFRIHTALQEKVLDSTIKEIGFIASVTVNKRTGRIINGHLRVQLALKNRIPTVPVEYVDLSDAEEAQALATYDPIGSMAKHDAEIFARLADNVHTSNNEIGIMLEQLSSMPDTGAVIAAEPAVDASALLDESNRPRKEKAFTEKYAAPYQVPRLLIGKKVYELSQPELDAINKNLDAYRDRYKTETGFWGWLCTNERK